MEEDHVRVLGMNLVEAIPDEVVVIEVKPTGECDFRPWRQYDLGFCAAFCCDEVAGVDHCCGEHSVIDH